MNIADEKAVEKYRKLFRSSDEHLQNLLGVGERNNERYLPCHKSYFTAQRRFARHPELDLQHLNSVYFWGPILLTGRRRHAAGELRSTIEKLI